MRKIKSQTVAAICCVGILAVAGGTVAMAQSPTILAGSGDVVTTTGEEESADTIQEQLCIWGTVLSVENGQICIDNKSGVSVEGEIVLNISEEDSRVLDAENGFPVQLSDIQVGETIYAYIGPAMTMSLPPQTFAEMVICKIPVDFKVPEYVDVESMEWSESGDWTLTSSAGTSYQIPANTPITPYLTRQLVTLADVTNGRRLLVWSDGENQVQKLVLFAE